MYGGISSEDFKKLKADIDQQLNSRDPKSDLGERLNKKIHDFDTEVVVKTSIEKSKAYSDHPAKNEGAFLEWLDLKKQYKAVERDALEMDYLFLDFLTKKLSKEEQDPQRLEELNRTELGF